MLRKVWQAADELGGAQAKFVQLIILTGRWSKQYAAPLGRRWSDDNAPQNPNRTEGR